MAFVTNSNAAATQGTMELTARDMSTARKIAQVWHRAPAWTMESANALKDTWGTAVVGRSLSCCAVKIVLMELATEMAYASVMMIGWVFIAIFRPRGIFICMCCQCYNNREGKRAIKLGAVEIKKQT